MRDFFTAGLRSPARLAVPFFVAMAVASCGGGGGGGSSGSSTNCLPYSTDVNCPTSGTGTQTATQLSLAVDTPTIQTDGSSVVTLTATLKDSKNAVVPGSVVSFTADSGSISASSATTDANGVATVTFNSNDNKTNRTVSFTAQSGSLSKATSVVVQGTRLGFGGDASAVLGRPVSMSVTLLDGASKAVAGQVISLRSTLGNAVPTSVTTDSNGQATLNFTPAVAGTDTITATALGASLTQSLVVSAVDFSFSSPAAGASVVVATCQPVTVQLLNVLATGAMFTASRGSVYATPNCSDAASTSKTVPFSGTTATAYVMSPGAGAGTVSALLSGGSVSATASLPLKFIATVASSIVVQADPSTVAVNGSASLTAVVKDVNGNPVSNQTVLFSAPNGGGTPSPATAATNDSGVASTTFKADSTISGKDSVAVIAAVSGTSIQATASLTVAGQAVNIVIGTDNQVVFLDSPPRYRKVWGVLVSDPASGPIKNQVVTVSLRGVSFDKGFYVVPSGATAWSRVTMEQCPAEDANNNGVVEVGEVGDLDGDNVLEPNGAAIVRSAASVGGSSVTVTTDESGSATFWVEYIRSYGSWAAVELKATAAVSGLNSAATSSFYLPVPASELLATTVSPSFLYSPYGVAASCYSSH